MKIVEQTKKKKNKQPKREKINASFIYSLLLLCISMCSNMCWYVHLLKVNFVVSSTVFGKVVFLPLPYTPASWKAACTVGSGPQFFIQIIKFIQMLRTKFSFSVSGSKQGLKALIPAHPFPYHLCSPQTHLEVWLGLSGHLYIPVILSGIQHLGLTESIIIWSCKNIVLFAWFGVFICLFVCLRGFWCSFANVCDKVSSCHTHNQHTSFYSARKW